MRSRSCRSISSLTRFNKMQIFNANQTGEELPYVKAKLNSTEWSTMSVLHDIGESAMSELAYACGFTVSRATRAVDTLVKFVPPRGGTYQVNRRIVRVKPTEKGIRLTEDNNDAIRRTFSGLWETCPRKKLETLIECYDKVLGIMPNIGGHPKTAAEFCHNLLKKEKSTFNCGAEHGLRLFAFFCRCVAQAAQNFSVRRRLSGLKVQFVFWFMRRESVRPRGRFFVGFGCFGQKIGINFSLNLLDI